MIPRTVHLCERSISRLVLSPTHNQNASIRCLKLCSNSHRNYSTEDFQAQPKTIEPLRILFCGSDVFSASVLNALYKESRNPWTDIASIDVVCRKGKYVGRGLTELRDPQIKSTALELGLPIHQLDTFTGWKPPRYQYDSVTDINLIVAVSFGLLVPARILGGAKYGGINLHPSMLPDFKGPAPIHWTLLEGESKSGVTLQTLHPSKFDEGIVLDQTPYPGIDIPNHEECTFHQLLRLVSAVAAKMLLKNIRNRNVIPPYQDVGWARNSEKLSEHPLRDAPKIRPSHRNIDFDMMTLSEIMTRNRVLSPLWSVSKLSGSKSPSPLTRLIYDAGMYEAKDQSNDAKSPKTVPTIRPGLPYVLVDLSDAISTTSAPLLINTKDRKTLVIPMLKLSGTALKPAAALAWKAKLMKFSDEMDGQLLYIFHEPLKYSDLVTEPEHMKS